MTGSLLDDACAVEQRVYLLFPSSLRITFYAQQVRAIALIDALAQQPWIADVTSIAIIGGGASGLTAAAALSIAGLREELTVTVFESRDQKLPLQSGSHDKFLAPHLIDWPKGEALATKAGLPILGWKKDTAANVALDLIEQLERFGFEVEPSHHVKRIHHHAKNVTLDFDGHASRDFDLVVIAAGFGLEGKPAGVVADTASYWRVHPNQGPVLAGQVPEKILISGLGDGGLIDFILFACPALNHMTLCERLLASPDIEPMLADIDQIEDQIWQSPPPVADIAAAYRALDIDKLARKQIEPHLAVNTQFTLLTNHSNLFHKGTSPLNRLAATLVRRAIEMADNGSSVRIITDAEHQSGDAKKAVYQVGGSTHEEDFDVVIVRHGDTSEKTWTFDNDQIDAKVEALRTARRAISTRPRTPELERDVFRRFEARYLASRPTRMRLSKVGNDVRWHGDISIDDAGRLWRAPSAAVHIEIDFAPSDLLAPGKLDLAVCRMLAHVEPKAEIAGDTADRWIAMIAEIPKLAGDRTQAAVRRIGKVTPDGNEYVAEADQLADRLETGLDAGLLDLLDDKLSTMECDLASCPLELHPDLHEKVRAEWGVWVNEVRGLGSDQRRWILRLLGGLLDKHGSPDVWSSTRVGPKCSHDELMPAIIFHLAMRVLLDDFGAATKHPTGNVTRRRSDGSALTPAHFCGSRWVANAGSRPTAIDRWERSWPAEQFVPSCLVLPSRTAEFLPTRAFTGDDRSAAMLAQPGLRTPIIIGSHVLKEALRTGESEAKSQFMTALRDALPEL